MYLLADAVAKYSVGHHKAFRYSVTVTQGHNLSFLPCYCVLF